MEPPRAKLQRGTVVRVALVAVMALVMGAPFIRGGFVGGDDHRLLLNHVLVNHPSLKHALQLFGIVHRDLYQPIPLLSFSAEFAVAQGLGLFKTGVESGARLFHLTNIILHAINAVLVYLMIVRLYRSLISHSSHPSHSSNPSRTSETIALIAAILFAVHPLQVEVVAWLNGRMMLLSTLFALLAMLAFDRWLSGEPRASARADTRTEGMSKGRDSARAEARGSLWAIASIILVTLCMMSKVRVGVPVLLFLVAVSQRRFGLRFLLPWLVCGVITSVFIFVNLKTTADSEFFSLAGEHMQGPRVVRVLRSLGWYVQHVVWPTGLASWYPAPPLVRWSDSETLTALLQVSAAFLLVAVACRHSVAARLGVLWFAATLVDTLPIVPARNILAADRYMYLSIIGLFWMLGDVLLRPGPFTQRAAGGIQSRLAGSPRGSALAEASGSLKRLIPRVYLVLAGILLIAAMIGTSWYTGSFYANSMDKTARLAQLFPTTPHVWARLGWVYHKNANVAQAAGRTDEAENLYALAIESANRELQQANPHGWSEAYQVLGVSNLKLGRIDEALAFLNRAVEIDPDYVEPKYWLAWAYDELDRAAEAIPYYEAALADAPGHNPTLLRLAKLYRVTGRVDEARRIYEKALANNAYEAPAVLGLVELDLEQGTNESLQAADRRLTELLEWMPENASAQVARGIIAQRAGRVDESIRTYEAILAKNPQDVTAALNLAQVYLAAGNAQRAKPLFDRAAESRPESLEQVVALQDFYLSAEEPDRAVALWHDYLSRFPNSIAGRWHAAWCLAKAGKYPSSQAILSSLDAIRPGDPQITAVRAYIAMADGRYSDAVTLTTQLCDTGQAGAAPRQRLLDSLEYFDRRQPNVPWTYCLAAQLLLADGKSEAAQVFSELCEKHCADPACREYLKAIADQKEKS